MPVQINELIIRAHIKETGDVKEAVAEDTAETMDKEEIIRECLERVLEVLQHQKER